MALQTTDQLAISRAGTNFKITGIDIINLIKDSVGTSEVEVATIAARDALAPSSRTIGDRVRVLDATGDATVTTGWAIYSWTGTVWIKIVEQEGLDTVVAASNLSYTPGAAGGQVNNTNGTGAALTLATATNAGLQSPANFTKEAFLTVTAATDLDAMRAASHAAVTTAGTGATNPIVVTGQSLSFNIAGLTLAP